MFSKKITDTDTFLDMPMSAQCLYFHLNMEADDEGFLGNAKTIRRKIGASEDDLKILLAKQFIIPFESGVVVIKDWKIHNYIRSDRFNETVYTEEKKLLVTKENGQYDIDLDGMTTCIPNGYQMDTQVRLGKERLEEGKDKKETIKTIVDAYASIDGELNKTLLDFIEMRKEIKKKLTPRALKMILNKLDKLAGDEYTKIKILEQSILHSWQDVYELKQEGPRASNEQIDKKMQGLNNWLNGGE